MELSIYKLIKNPCKHKAINKYRSIKRGKQHMADDLEVQERAWSAKGFPKLCVGRQQTDLDKPPIPSMLLFWQKKENF